MSGKRLAIVTPVYNRAAELLALFESLSHQDRQEFKWYVVDDGSTDGSWEVIERMKEMAAFPVDVFRKENGGKHAAVNLAMRHVTEPLTFIVDSDDVLPSNSVDIILNSFDEISDSAGLCGISFLRRMEHAPQETDFPEAKLRGSYMDVRINGCVTGDKAEVFYTQCLKEFPFPEFDGERFYHEDGVWVRLSTKYEMLYENKIVYKGRYLEGGLTKGGRALKMASPLGMCDRSAQFLGYPGKVLFKQRIKHAILWDVYTAVAKSHGQKPPCECPAPVLCAAMAPVAVLLRRKWEGELHNG